LVDVLAQEYVGLVVRKFEKGVEHDGQELLGRQAWSMLVLWLVVEQLQDLFIVDIDGIFHCPVEQAADGIIEPGM
jgi:hypothetical protein